MKGQPKGLIAAALANMGERFGFYIMMAILTLFISAKFGLNETTAGYIYSGFYASIYLLALVGGIIADKTRNYKGTIMWGLVVMSLGYLIIAIPTPTPVSSLPLYLTLTCVGLLVIAFGNGLFKGNLQALVGQMYDNKEFSAKRESGFQIFYMFINIGGFFAPFVAIGVRNWWLKVNNFDYNAKLPELCHEYLAKGEHMAGEGLLARLKPGAVVMNSSRGEVVDGDALLRSGHPCVLDVWEHEPRLDPQLLDRTLLATPHVAGYSEQGKATATAMSVATLAGFFGLPLRGWYPSEAAPSVPRPIPWQELCTTIGDAYDIEAESCRLKARPADFEAMRDHYRYRREYF